MKKLSLKKKKVIVESKFTDLRQVMDYKRPLSIFYSGVENEYYLDTLYNIGIRNFLMSYEYLKGKGYKQLKRHSDMHLFIDSGAFTYINNPEFESYTNEQWEKQIYEYLNWAEKNKDSIFAIADLDLQYIVGEDTVYRWRKEYFEPFMLRTGIPVCFIYHEEGFDVWEYMCKRYPYVGFSLAVDNVTENEIMERFRIAEKYNTLVQGMASTRTSMLTNFPFYTVDSTTWNVGLKYGEISVWNGNKMSRIKKKDFETKAIPVIERYDMKFDKNLILEEDNETMIQVNAYAFVQAEKFINERLKSKMYWFKKRTEKRDLENLPDNFYPTSDWLLSDEQDDYIQYAENFNINPEYEDVKNLIFDVTAIMNWDNEEYSNIREWYENGNMNLIDEIHDEYVNRIVNTVEEKIFDLKDFFSKCISGEEDKLLQLGTNFDRTIKERDFYIDDSDEMEEIELSDIELKQRLKNVLPTDEDFEDGMPEIDSLDEEIFKKAEIIPTFDEKGKFLKGQVSVRKPKQIYSSKFPKIACDTCYAAQRCPHFKSGYVCAFNKLINKFDTRNMNDIVTAMQGMVDFNLSRMQRAMIIENLTGNFEEKVTSLISQNMNLLKQLNDLYKYGSSEVLKQTRVIMSDGTEEHTMQVTNPRSGGILEKLFCSPTKEDKEIVDID